MSQDKRRFDHHSNFHNKRSRTDTQIAKHYNARPERNTQERQHSPIFQLKALNNYIKSQLIKKFCFPGYKVLDMCCGKGGDLLKFDIGKIDEYFGVDLAAVSVDQARERFTTMRRSRFKAEFCVADCFDSKSLDAAIDPLILSHLTDSAGATDVSKVEGYFDLISAQFSIHYAFETEEKARDLFRNVGKYLKDDQYFIGTCPRADWITEKMKSLPKKPDGQPSLQFGNDLYQIRFREEVDDDNPFGQKYWFILEDAIDDCPEFLVHMPTLKRIALEYDLELELCKHFHQFFYENKDPELMGRMKVLDSTGGFEPNQWEIAFIYQVFAFRKVRKVREVSPVTEITITGPSDHAVDVDAEVTQNSHEKEEVPVPAVVDQDDDKTVALTTLDKNQAETSVE